MVTREQLVTFLDRHTPRRWAFTYGQRRAESRQWASISPVLTAEGHSLPEKIIGVGVWGPRHGLIVVDTVREKALR